MDESIRTSVRKNEGFGIITRITITQTKDTVITYNSKESSDGSKRDPNQSDNIRNDSDILVENHIQEMKRRGYVRR